MNQVLGFKCRVCGHEYKTAQAAADCEQINGPGQKPKFPRKTLIWVNFGRESRQAIVKDHCYCQPGQPGRMPHQLLYLLYYSDFNRTTAIEKELSPRQ